MALHYTLADLLTISLASLSYALFGLAPGYVLAWLTNLFQFRRRTWAERMLISVAGSFAWFPIIVYWAGRFLSMTAVWLVCAAMWGGLVGLFIREFRDRPQNSEPSSPGRGGGILLAMAAWLVVGLMTLADLQVGNRLYPPTVAYDYNIRVAFVAALSRDGIPPANPLFFPGHAVPLRYHYFGLLASSLVNRLAAPLVGARQALIAGTLWTGLALMAVIALYCRFFSSRPGNSWRRSVIGIALLTITGIDIIPVGLMAWAGFLVPSLEWWNEPVMSWVHALLWVPQHVAGLVACLFGFLVLQHSSQEAPRERWLAVVAAALSFATAVGTSIYVSFAFAVFMAVWTMLNWAWKDYGELKTLLASGGMAALLSLPYLLDLRADSAGGPFLLFDVRYFAFTDALLNGLSVHDPWVRRAVDLLALPVNYLFELGFFFVVGVWWLRKVRSRRQPMTREQVAGLAMVGSTLVLCSLVRSGVIGNNDLGWRGPLVAQFMLLIWAAEGIEEWWSRGRTSAPTELGRFAQVGVAVLLCLGLAGSMYEVGMTRIFPILSDSGLAKSHAWLAPDRQFGQRAYALRQTYEDLSHRLPPGAIVQHNPNVFVGDLFYGMYADRQSAAGIVQCGAVFGGELRACLEVIRPLSELFTMPELFDAARVREMCRRFSIDILVVKDTDRAWTARSGWPSELRPMGANRFARVYTCSPEPVRDGGRVVHK